jgi:hypothetical protein
VLAVAVEEEHVRPTHCERVARHSTARRQVVARVLQQRAWARVSVVQQRQVWGRVSVAQGGWRVWMGHRLGHRAVGACLV